jgi:hypothetical protein
MTSSYGAVSLDTSDQETVHKATKEFETEVKFANLPFFMHVNITGSSPLFAHKVVNLINTLMSPIYRISKIA